MYRFFILFCIFINLSLFAQTNVDKIKINMPKDFILGQKDSKIPVWELIDKDANVKGYIFESYEHAPVLGFSGGKINTLVSIDKDGNFIDVKLLEQDEPVFVSGLGVIPFIEFLNQYKGKNLASTIKIDSTKESTSNVTYIDGVTKATASVKIANDSILASSIKIAGQKLSGVAPKQILNARKDIFEKLSWNELLKKDLVKHVRITNKQAKQLFEDSDFHDDFEDDEQIYIELFIANLAIPSVERNVLKKSTIDEINIFDYSEEDPILILANGEYELFGEDFVPNSSPDSLEVVQDGFPINSIDADIEVFLKDKIPSFEQAFILNVDKRFNFDPSSTWNLNLKILKGKQTLFSDVISKNITLEISNPKKYFEKLVIKEEVPIWLSTIYEQQVKLSILAIYLTALFIILYKYKTMLNSLRYKRTVLLLITLFFIGWYSQGQLSIVTVLGVIKAIVNSQTLNFLLYDPLSLLIWFFVLISLIIWGRGTFCGWLCPYGVLQELSYYFARVLKLPTIKVPQKLNDKLIYVKYIILAILILTAIFAPTLSDKLVEIEPFKTSITLVFDREIPYVLYALFWIVLSMFLFKGFCRFFCPLGAFLSLAGRLKFLDWLPRRKECGNPCNNCYKNCNYAAIDKKDGHIKYNECFQCLDCVQIYSDDKLCKILIKDAKAQKKVKVNKWEAN